MLATASCVAGEFIRETQLFSRARAVFVQLSITLAPRVRSLARAPYPPKSASVRAATLMVAKVEKVSDTA